MQAFGRVLGCLDKAINKDAAPTDRKPSQLLAEWMWLKHSYSQHGLTELVRGIWLEVLVPCKLAWNGKSEGSRLRHLHAKKPLVEGSGKECIQQVLMDESQAQDTPTEAKPKHRKYRWTQASASELAWIVPSNHFSAQVVGVACSEYQMEGFTLSDADKNSLT